MPRGGRGGGRNNGLSWVKKPEPKFIREFKERIAYKEQASLEAKVSQINHALYTKNFHIFKYFRRKNRVITMTDQIQSPKRKKKTGHRLFS